jgi:PAS domain S-box-containing protein
MASPPSDLLLRHLAKIVDSSDDAIVSKDLNGTILSWNAAAERMFGYTSEEAVGRSIRMIIPDDRQSEEDFVLGQIRAGQAVRHHETIRQRKNGTQIPISLTVSPIYDDQGHVIGASKIARDITDRKDADRNLKRLAAVVESSDDAIVAKDLNSTIIAWNRAAERMFGYTAEEAIGRSVRMIIPDDLQPEEDMVLGRIRSGGLVDHYETRRRRKDGSEVLVSLTVSPIVDETGRVTGASKIARDITEQSRLRAAAREQTLVTERLSETGATVAASLDRHTIVQRVVDAATSLTQAEFGAFVHDVGAATDYTLSSHAVPPRDVVKRFLERRWDTLVTSTFSRDGAIRLDDVHDAADARWVIRSFLAVPVKTAAGEVLGGLLFGSSASSAFSDQHERIASAIAAWASLALENARLYLAARDADRLKDEFLAVLSHELRTPLNAIVGYARMLRGGFLSGVKMERGLETLERNANALTQIVEDVLDISRIVAGKIRLDVQPVDLSTIVQNAASTVQPAADAKSIRIETIVDPGVGPVSGDPGRLQQVAWNLLTNAVKFTPKNGRVQVRVERVNSHIEVAVSDTGVGINPEFLPYVFERFRQADGSLSRKAGGLGLGLSIVRHIVEMHGGSVLAASDGEGRGATFKVRLPLMIVHASTAEGKREHPRTEAAPPLAALADLTGVRVMAVDDEEDALGLLRVVLEAAGAEVITSSSAEAALDRIAAARPHVLVVDLGMPAVDGFQFITRLRGSDDAEIRNIPAAALTAFARSEDRTKALRSGFEMHLAKPVDPGELVASVATLVRRGGSGGRSGT